MPDPLDLPSGCPFHPRCPQCMDLCRTVVPGVLDDGGHRVMCHLYGRGAPFMADLIKVENLVKYFPVAAGTSTPWTTYPSP